MNALPVYLTTLAHLVCARLGGGTKGATAVEYGLLVALIAAVIIAAVTLFGENLSAVFNQIATSIAVK